MKFGIDADRLKSVFPFHIAFNANMELLQCGDSILKLCPKIKSGDAWTDHFSITRPKQITDITTLREHLETLFVISCVNSRVDLKGEILFLEESDTYLFLATPIIRDVASLAGYGIGLNDFARHDPIVDFMFLMQARDKSLQEVAEYSDKLKGRNRELDRLKFCLDRAVDGVFMFNAKTLEFFYLNQEALNQTGYTADELMTMTPIQIKPELSEESYMAMIAPLISGAESSHKFETLHQHKDGSLMPVEIGLQYIAESAGRDGYFIAIVRDVTDRKLAERELKKLSLAVEQAGESIIITDRDGIIEYVNPAFTEITGYLPEEAIGKTPAILKSGVQDERFYQQLWETITRGEIWYGTLIDRKKDGSFYPAQLSVAPIADESGEISHYVGIQQDISEQQQLEEQLRQSQKMEAIGTLVGGIAHDFNNMLAGMMGNVFLVRKKMKSGDTCEHHLKNIEKVGKRAAEMIRQLLIFARKDTPDLESFSLPSIVDEAISLMRSAIPENIDLKVRVEAGTSKIRGNSTQLQQVLINLIGNSRDALKDVLAPFIDVEVKSVPQDDAFYSRFPERCGGDYLSLSVRDNGCGIAEYAKEKIFEPFYTSKGVGEGTGLGLSMVYGSVRNHGGEIEVESEPGSGTLFTLYFPIDKHSRRNIASYREGEEVIEGAGELILVADDEEDVRRTTCEVLESLGYSVVEASDGQEAVDCFRDNRERVSLLLLDVVMPGKGGVMAAKEIQEISPETPCLFATGYEKAHAFADDPMLEQYQILNKPFTVETLSQMIHQVLNSGSN